MKHRQKGFSSCCSRTPSVKQPGSQQDACSCFVLQRLTQPSQLRAASTTEPRCRGYTSNHTQVSRLTSHSGVCRNSMPQSSPCRCACTADSLAAQICFPWSPCGAARGAQLSATCAATANCIHCTLLTAPPLGTTPWTTPNSLQVAQLLAVQLLLLLQLHSWQSSATEVRAWTAEALLAMLCKMASRKALEAKRIWHATSGLPFHLVVADACLRSR